MGAGINLIVREGNVFTEQSSWLFFHLKLNCNIQSFEKGDIHGIRHSYQFELFYPLFSFWLFLLLTAKMLVINMKKLLDYYVMALELHSVLFCFFSFISVKTGTKAWMWKSRCGVKCYRIFLLFSKLVFMVEVIFLWQKVVVKSVWCCRLLCFKKVDQKCF